MNNSARQNVRGAIEKVLFSDLDATAKNLFTKLPNGVIPLSLVAVIITPFDTGTTHVGDIGFAAHGAVSADPDAYFNDLNLKAAAGTRVSATALPVMIDTAAGGLQLTLTDVPVGTAATEGEVHFYLTYMEDGVEHCSQG